jgi:Domain of unknown function (DUF4214)
MLARAKVISASELMSLNDREFVEECYRQILLREPDPEGVVHYLTRVGLGDDRLALAASIASSDEGREKARSRHSLAADILSLHAERLIISAWTPWRRRSAAKRIIDYMSTLSGRPGRPVLRETSIPDPFSDYLRNVIEGGN